jgi:hypothetical protein
MSSKPKAPSANIALLPAPAESPATHAETRQVHRHGGWTPERQAAFLRELAASHCVTRAAKHVGMGRQSAYRLRNRLKGEPFDIAWACAFRRQYDALAEVALQRALNGVEVPHFYKGELVHTSRRFDERLTIALLAMKERLTAPPYAIRYEHMLAPPDNFESLVDRVETGEELWADEEEGEEWEE